jgi:hypothetical protein
VSLAASSKALKPDESDRVIETAHGPIVPGRTVIGIGPLEHSPEPSTIYVDGPIHPDAEFIFDPTDLGEHDLALRLASDDKGSVLSSPVTEVRESEEVERLRFALAPPASVSGSKPAQLDQASFVGVQTERKASQPFLQIRQKTFRVLAVLEAGDTVVSVADDNDIASRTASPPLLRPKIEDIVEINIR